VTRQAMLYLDQHKSLPHDFHFGSSLATFLILPGHILRNGNAPELRIAGMDSGHASAFRWL